MSSKDRAVREAAAGAISGVLEQNVRLFAPDHEHAGQGQADRGRVAQVRAPDLLAQPRQPGRGRGGRGADRRPRATSIRGISHRYYALKARWLGLERLEFWDRNAPLPEDADTRRPWADAKVVVLDAYRSFSPTLAEIVDRFFAGLLDRRPAAAGQGQRRLLPPDRAERPSLRPDELSGPQSRRDDPGARAGPRRPPGAGRPAGAADGGHALDPGRDRLGVRRAADLPGAAGAGGPTRCGGGCCWRPRSRTRSTRSCARSRSASSSAGCTTRAARPS